MGFETALQTAIYGVLSTDPGVTALVVAVYDDVPQPSDTGSSADFPYITIGEGIHNDWSTDTELGDDASITIHTWSRYRGRKEVKQIQGAIYDALARATFSVLGYTLVSIDWVSSETLIDADGKTRHGVQTFRVLLDEV